MKKILFIAFFCAVWIPQFSYANTFTQKEINGVTLQYVSYTVGSEDYNIHVATSDSVTNIETLAAQENAITGINGIFFCPADYSECKGENFTINERFVDGVDTSFYDDTGDRAVFAWGYDGVPFLFQTGKINPEKRIDIYEGMGNYPILYVDGYNMLEKYHDLGLYDKKMSTPMKRHYICSNKDKSEIFFGSSSAATLDDLAPALYAIGCWDGINLDAGASTQYMYNGRRLEWSGRNVLDGFVIERVGLNVAEIQKAIDAAGNKLTPLFKRMKQENAEIILDKYIDLCNQIRRDIYEENSIDLYDASGNDIWYQIDIDDLKTLKRVYSVNMLERKLKEIKSAL